MTLRSAAADRWVEELRPIVDAVRSGGALDPAIALELLPGRVVGVRENPHRAVVEAEVEAICHSLGVRGSRMFHHHIKGGRLSALCFPDAPRLRLRVCHLAVVLVFMFDDALDSGSDQDVDQGVLASAFKRVMAGERDPLIPGCPLLRLAHRVYCELEAANPGTGWTRRLRALFDHFVDAALAARRRWVADEKPPSLTTYVNERYYDVAVGFVLALAEFANGVELTTEQWDDDRVQSLRAACTFYIAFVNDLFSYHKEVLQRGNFNNLLAVLQSHEGLDFEAAATATVVAVKRCFDGFQETTAALMSDPQAPTVVRDHLHAMRAWMLGSLQWSLETLRYRHPESPFPELAGARSDRTIDSDHVQRVATVTEVDATEPDRLRADSPSAPV